MEPMGSSSRVGYDCGEHDYQEDGNSGLHHLHLKGEKLDEDGWGDFFPADGYFPTAAERAELYDAAAAEITTLPADQQLTFLRTLQEIRVAATEDTTLRATPGQLQRFDDEMRAMIDAITIGPKP